MTANNEESFGNPEGKLHVDYLRSAADYLKDIPSNALRCHWNILLGDIMHMKRVALDKSEIHYFSSCKYCMTPWKNGVYSVKVMPKRKRGKKLRKILRRVKEQKELSKFQKSLASVMHTGSTVVVICKICHKSSKFRIPQGEKVIIDKYDFGNSAQVEEEIKKVEMKKAKNTRRKKRLKRRQKALLFNQVSSEQPQGSVMNNNTVQVETQMNNDDDDDDVTIIDENIEVIQITNTQTKKRKLNDNDNNIGDALKSKLGKPKKISKKKDVTLANPLPITPLGAQSTESAQYNDKKDDFISLVTYNSGPKVNDLSKSLHQIGGRQIKNTKKEVFGSNNVQNERKKNSLSRWKRLIADEESKPIKTSSLQDFLSAL